MNLTTTDRVAACAQRGSSHTLHQAAAPEMTIKESRIQVTIPAQVQIQTVAAPRRIPRSSAVSTTGSHFGHVSAPQWAEGAEAVPHLGHSYEASTSIWRVLMGDGGWEEES